MLSPKKGKQPREQEPVEMADLLQTCLDHFETADVTIVTDLDSTIRADRSRLQQLLENLLRNAVEYGDEDGTVKVGSLPDGFYVADDGPGIPEGEREDVWKAGYSRTDEGTGIGLSIVKQIVEAHDWAIRIAEGSGGGARFEITGVEVVAE